MFPIFTDKCDHWTTALEHWKLIVSHSSRFIFQQELYCIAMRFLSLSLAQQRTLIIELDDCIFAVREVEI